MKETTGNNTKYLLSLLFVVSRWHCRAQQILHVHKANEWQKTYAVIAIAYASFCHPQFEITFIYFICLMMLPLNAFIRMPLGLILAAMIRK